MSGFPAHAKPPLSLGSNYGVSHGFVPTLNHQAHATFAVILLLAANGQASRARTTRVMRLRFIEANSPVLRNAVGSD